jgi:hypothetical protein
MAAISLSWSTPMMVFKDCVSRGSDGVLEEMFGEVRGQGLGLW